MRFLLDTYIKAGASEVVSNFEDEGLIDLIVKLGAGAIDKLPPGIRRTRRRSPKPSSTTRASSSSTSTGRTRSSSTA